MNILRFFFIFCAFLFSTSAMAQYDGYAGGYLDTAIAVTQDGVNQALIEEVLANEISSNSAEKKTPHNKQNLKTSSKSKSLLSQPIAITLSYTPNSQIARMSQQEFVGRLMSKNPAAAKQVMAQLQQHSATNIFASFAQAVGVPTRDPSSSMAIYSAIAWSIANRTELNPNNPADMARVRGLRTQFAQSLSVRPTMVDASSRQKLDEELMILTVVLDAGHNSAKTREGPAALAALSNGVNAMWIKQFGKDLRTLKLTNNGFERK